MDLRSLGVAVYVFCVVTRSEVSPDGNSDMSFFIHQYPAGTGDFRRFPYAVHVSAPRRGSVPMPGHAPPITIYDLFTAIHSSLSLEMREEEVAHWPQMDVQRAAHTRSIRLTPGSDCGSTNPRFIRSDFLHGCCTFAGILYDRSTSTYAIKLSTY